MNNMESAISSGFSDYYHKSAGKLHQWVDPLSTQQIWSRPYPYGNSIGHLLLHLTGNLNYYIGARIANTGYVRNRDLEFNDANHKPKEELLGEFDRTIAMVIATMGKQQASDWAAEYSAQGSNSKDRFAMILTCAGHLDHHVGQIIYLAKEISRRQSVTGKS